MSSSESIVLRYFNIRGKAEAFRMFFEMAGIEYTEERFSRDEWFSSKKKEYKEKGISLFGQVPVVSVGNKHMCQSLAVLRYFAKKKNVYGDNEDEQYTCDMLMDGVEDWRSAHVRIVYNPDYDTLVGGYVQNTVPVHLENFEHFLSMKYDKNTNKRVLFVWENRWNLADIMVFDMLENILRLDATILQKYPLLAKFHEQFKNEPAMKKYLQSGKRPEMANNSGKG
jgi:glutathione S-transferase